MSGAWTNTSTTSLTLPTNATSGARIVLDGTGDSISVYDANNNLVDFISPTNTFFNGSLQAGSISAGSIGSSSIVNSTMTGGNISETTITFDTNGGKLLMYATTITTNTYNTSSTFTVPGGVTSVTLKAWGGGGGAAGGGKAGGANSGGYGGGGGAYSQATVSVTPGDTLTITVGTGGNGGAANNLGSNGTDSKVVNGALTTLLLAKAGQATTVNSPSLGGSASSGIGTILFSGGNGGSATGQGGSGGGGAAGAGGAGGNGASTSTDTGGTGGVGNGAGGNGGNGGNTNVNGVPGTAPGGGGGGGGGAVGSAGSGGNGATGQVIILYTNSSSLVGSASPIAGTDSSGNAYPTGIAGISASSYATLGSDAKLGFGANGGSVDTNLYRSASGVLKTDNSLIISGVGGFLCPYKTANNTPANNTTAYQNDSDLFTTVTANGIYVYELFCLFVSSATANFKVQFSLPTGATILGGASFIATQPTATYGITGTTGAVSGITGTGGTSVFQEWGLLQVGGTGGTFQFQWGQNTAQASNTYTAAGSFLNLRRVA